MQLLVFVTSLLAATAQAADLCSASAPDCRGVLRCCRNIRQNRCCNFGVDSRSVRLTLPRNSRAQAYSGDRCIGIFNQFRPVRPGTTCHPWQRRSSAQWQMYLPLVKARQEEPEPEPIPEPIGEPLPAEPEPGPPKRARDETGTASRPMPADQCVDADLVITEDGRELSVPEARAAGLI